MARYGVSPRARGRVPERLRRRPSSATRPRGRRSGRASTARPSSASRREWAKTAETTGGKCSIIIGAGVNHWYHNNLMYRAGIVCLMLTGCVGKNGGGLNHYVGQEKLAPDGALGLHRLRAGLGEPAAAAERALVALRAQRPVALRARVHRVPPGARTRRRWLKATPSISRSRRCRTAGCPSSRSSTRAASRSSAKRAPRAPTTEAEIVAHVVERLRSRRSASSRSRIRTRPENWPRIWYIWRGNALMSSAKGHEYFLKHYLGTHTNTIAKERAEGSTKDVVWHDAPEGKIDLIVDLNFRMDTSALYSDIVLPAATWYEKDDLNSTDMHSFIHPLSEATPPAGSRDRTGISSGRSRRRRRSSPCATSRAPVDDLVMTPLAARHPGGDGAAADPRLDQRRVRADPGKDDAGVQARRPATIAASDRSSSRSDRRCEKASAHTASSSTSPTTTTSSSTHAATVEVEGQRLPSIAEARDAARRHPRARPRDQRRDRLPRLRVPREEDRRPADRPRRGRAGGAGRASRTCRASRGVSSTAPAGPGS